MVEYVLLVIIIVQPPLPINPIYVTVPEMEETIFVPDGAGISMPP